MKMYSAVSEIIGTICPLTTGAEGARAPCGWSATAASPGSSVGSGFSALVPIPGAKDLTGSDLRLELRAALRHTDVEG